MTHPPAVWPVCDVVIFDCDSTLSSVEGIDELARANDQQTRVAALTQRAMDGEVPLEQVYRRRLDMSNLTQALVNGLWRTYQENVIADAREVIAALQDLGCHVFIVSGGLFEPVRDFGVWLGVPRENIYAVSAEYDQLAGAWWRYWEQPGGQNPNANYMALRSTPLSGSSGKAVIIDQIRSRYRGRAMLIGDGLSDLEAMAHVDLFVGFGGVVHRERVAAQAPVYLKTAHLSPIVPLALGRLGYTAPWRYLMHDGAQRIAAREVIFQDESMRESLLDAISRADGE
jgi:phosphoserine phosphatase